MVFVREYLTSDNHFQTVDVLSYSDKNYALLDSQTGNLKILKIYLLWKC